MKTRSQHYVFQAYLSGFSIERPDTNKFVWVYDKEFCNENAPKKPKSIRSVCAKAFYYSQTTEGDDVLEKCFSDVERDIAPIIRQLEVVSGQKVALNETQVARLAFGIALSMTRVPSFRDPIEKMHKRVAEYVADYCLDDIKGPNREDAREYVQKLGGLKVDVKKWVSLEPMIKMAEFIAMSLFKKNWQFFKAPKEITFVTSDNPVISDCHIRGANVGPAHPLSQIVFPLRKDIALVCTPYGESMVAYQATSQEVKKINRGVVRAARKYIISDQRSDAFARLVSKHKGHEQTMIVD